jgi:membrane protein YqaA with SNARE-associated domain
MEIEAMLEPETTLIIGWISGGAVGYVLGFFMARMLYRRATWPS